MMRGRHSLTLDLKSDDGRETLVNDAHGIPAPPKVARLVHPDLALDHEPSGPAEVSAAPKAGGSAMRLGSKETMQVETISTGPYGWNSASAC